MLVTSLTGTPAAQAGVCDAGYRYHVSTSYGTRELLGASTWVQNRTQDNLTRTMTATSTKTHTGSVTVSATMSGTFLKAKAEYSVGASYEYSVSKSLSDSVTMTIRPGYEGRLAMYRWPTFTTVQKRYYAPDCSYYVAEKGHVRASKVKVAAQTRLF